MLPPPSLVARGPILASLFGLGIIYLWGDFWQNANSLKVQCRGEETTVATCAVGAFRTASLALLVVGASQFYNTALVVPVPKARRSEELSHWLSPEFTHIGYTQPDERGYHHILYLNHPTTPSKIRFNMADPGVHASELVNRDLEDLSFWVKRQQKEDENWFVDVSSDDEVPPGYNDFTGFDALTFVDNLNTNIIDYFSTNNVDGSCFFVQYRNLGTLRKGIIKVVPSTTGNGGKNYPTLECGTDPLAFNISIPLF